MEVAAWAAGGAALATLYLLPTLRASARVQDIRSCRVMRGYRIQSTTPYSMRCVGDDTIVCLCTRDPRVTQDMHECAYFHKFGH